MQTFCADNNKNVTCKVIESEFNINNKCFYAERTNKIRSCLLYNYRLVIIAMSAGYN